MSRNSYFFLSLIRNYKHRRFIVFALLGGFLFLMCMRVLSHASSEGKSVINVNDVFVPTGWMGDTNSLFLNTNSTDTYHSSPDSIKVEYRPVQENWVGIYWQTPPDNWGSEPGANLSGAAKLTFWVRGAKGDEVVEFLAGGINSPGLKYKDSFHASTQRLNLAATWKQYTIDLENHDLYNVIGGFAFIITSRRIKSEKTVFYLDDIRYEWKAEKGLGTFSIQVLNPQEGENVERTYIARGTASIPSGTHLWVLTRREDFEGLWWPQAEAKINQENNEWKVSVTFGIPEDIGWEFDIAIIVVTDNNHAILRDYRMRAMKTGDWRPIEMPQVLAAPILRKVIKIGH
jgi:hypothetical protein